MNAAELLEKRLAECPLVAVLRGLEPKDAVAVGEALYGEGFRIIEVPLNSPQPFESIGLLARALGERALIGAGTVLDPADVRRVADVGEALYDEGFRIIEVPLNSPQPFESIGLLARALGERALIGAGTVLDPADVRRVADVGGRIVVSPNTYVPVIEATVQAGLVSAPGYYTPSEGFEALRAGAHVLKLFPAEAVTPPFVRGQLAVLPKAIPLLVVGGITPDNMRPYLDAGARGFGLGSGLYKPGRTPDEVRERARAYVAGLG